MSNSEACSSSSTAIPIASSNIGFQLLKKHGWKEGTGLGISQQGRLEPVQTHIKKNKRGLGAAPVIDKPRKKTEDQNNATSDNANDKLSKRSKAKMSKKLKKAQELEKQLQEKEFERAFYREFWPDNV
uniref:G patch domain and ankyrin repeat-containing protein 1 homolog n=1 Tax=Erigeron canadensis TaxID=72917 RepID=UPI001CB9AB04|nr:G patch domain and ankyrin repeat-containing protein 1 homolog [Erigeron canadensis]